MLLILGLMAMVFAGAILLALLVLAGEKKLKKQAYRLLEDSSYATSAEKEKIRKLVSKLSAFKDEEARELVRQLMAVRS